MIIRLSHKLRDKIKVGTLARLPADENPFADWTATLFLVGRAQYILVGNTKSLYSVVMHGKGITSDHRFIERALANLREFMEADGLAFIHQRFIAPTTETIRFAAALDRSVTGSLNDLIMQARFVLADVETSPHDAALKLNGTYLTAIAPSAAEKYGVPREVFKSLATVVEP